MEVSFQEDLLSKGLIRLKLMINDNPYYFLVDSGSSTNYISPEVAHCLRDRLQIVGEGRTVGYGRKLFGKKELIVELSFEFNDEPLTLEFQIMSNAKPFKVLDYSGFHVDGILGFPFLYMSKATIDYADLVIRFDKDRERKVLNPGLM